MSFVNYLFSRQNTSNECKPTLESATPLVQGWMSHSKAPEWECFYAPEIFIKWAADLKISIALKDMNAWELTGKNAVLVSSTQIAAVDLFNRIASEAGMSFFNVPATDVQDLVPGIRSKFHEHAPAIVFLEAGEWIAPNSDNGIFAPFNTDETVFSKTLRSDLIYFDPQHPVVIVTAVSSDRLISKGLTKVGAFDRIFTTEKPSAEFLGEQFVAKVGRDLFDEYTLKNSRKKIGLLLQSEFEEADQQDLLVLRIKRLAKSESRKITFNDLANFALRGLIEHSQLHSSGVDATIKRKTAIHEAGHACIAIIASDGQNVPDYATVVPSKNFLGVVYESLSYYEKMDEFTFNNMLLKARVCLAGRAAEDLFFGSSNVSSGANSDLAAVSRMCFSLFAFSGFHPEMINSEIASSNLAVLNSSEVDPIQYDRISKDVRNFLHEQYHYVIQTLKQNSEFVEAVADRLLWGPVVDQSEMIEIALKFGIKVG